MSDGSPVPAVAGATPGTRGRDLLLCLSHLRWNFVFQRPQHLLTRAARTHDVLVVEEPVFDHRPTPEMLRHRVGEGLDILVPHLPRDRGHAADVTAQRNLLQRVLADHAGQRLITWFYTPMALEFMGDVPAAVTVYDCMDELAAFAAAPPRMLALETELLQRAGIVFTGGRSLFEAKRDRHPNVHCFPSSIDAAHFAVARQQAADPPDQAEISHPRVGFFGVVDERMDTALVGRLATLRPDIQWVMLGPVVKIDPASLPRRENLHWLGGKSYADLPAYLGGWDAGFMPFALNDSTRFISPTKTPEFLAAGLPVVSTPIPDVVRGWGDPGLVEIAADATAMATAIDRLLTAPRDAWRARVDARLAQESWDATWAGMRAEIQRVLPPSRSIPHV